MYSGATAPRAFQATSPTGEYHASFEQSICADPGRSRSEVLIGKRGVKERIVALEIRGTSEVGLTWQGESTLFAQSRPAEIGAPMTLASGQCE